MLILAGFLHVVVANIRAWANRDQEGRTGSGRRTSSPAGFQKVDKAPGEAVDLLIGNLEAVPGAVIRVADLLVALATPLAKQHDLGGVAVGQATAGRHALAGGVEVALVVVVHGENVVKVGKVLVAELAGLVRVELGRDAVVGQDRDGARVRGLADVVGAGAARVDGFDERMRVGARVVCQVAEDAFSHGRAACGLNDAVWLAAV